MKRPFLIILSALFLLAACTPAATETSADIDIPAKPQQLKYVALTFDDGPRAGITDVLLDGLWARGAAATFFVVGEQIPGNENLVRRMAAEGHQVGNHTYGHIRLSDATDDEITAEIHKTEALLQEILGEGDYWLRPPYGLVDLERTELIETPMIYWSLDTEDWKNRDAQIIADAVLSEVESGDIVLLHDFYPTSAEAALTIVDTLQKDGYAFVTVEQLFEIAGATAEPGVLYATAIRRKN